MFDWHLDNIRGSRPNATVIGNVESIVSSSVVPPTVASTLETLTQAASSRGG